MTTQTPSDLLSCETTALAVAAQFNDNLKGAIPELQNLAFIFDWGAKLNGVCTPSACNLVIANGRSNVAGLIQMLRQVRAFETRLLDMIEASDNQLMAVLQAAEAEIQPTEPVTNATTSEKTAVNAAGEHLAKPARSREPKKHTGRRASTNAGDTRKAVAAGRRTKH